jgi:DNA-directed RNA polymerase specialized sigma24 family protein
VVAVIPPTDSVTHWLDQLQAGDPSAAEKLWDSYFRRLVALARARLQGVPRGAADEEDVALSAFDSFCRGAQRGRFPQLSDRNNLWRLLVVITSRKALDLAQHEARKKRGGAAPEGAAFPGPRHSAAVAGLDQLSGREPTPEFAAEVAEECQRLLDRLGDGELRSVALWKMEGYSIDEIAGKLGCAPRTVDRKLWVIRTLWEQKAPP